MAKNAKLLEELVIKVNSRALKQAVKEQDQLSDRMEDAAAGTELLNEQLVNTNAALTEARKLSRGLANTLETIGTGANMQDYFDGVVAAIQDVEGTISELSASFEEYTHIARQGNDEVVLTLERLLDPLRKVDQQTKKTADSTEKLQDGLKGVGDQQGKTTKGTEGAQRSTKGATRAFQDLAKIAGPLPMIYATIAANVYALTEAYNQLAAGDRLNRLEKINQVIGAETGVSISNLADIMVEATGYAVSFEGAMQKAAQASAYGFSSDQVSQFTLAARRASVALGVDLDDALNRIIRGVSKLEIELLDELGITVRLTEAYDKYQRSLGVSQTALTGYQKQQAYANAVIEESQKRFGSLDKEMKATEWEKFAQNIDQTTKSGQKMLATFLTPMAQHFNTLFEESQVDKVIERVNRLNQGLATAAANKNFLAQATLQANSSEDLILAEEELIRLKEQYNKALEATQQAEQKYGRVNSVARAENNKQLAVIQNLEKVMAEFKKQIEANYGAAVSQERGTQEYNQQLQFLASTFREVQQLAKSIPEVVQAFDASVKSPALAIEQYAAGLQSTKQTIDNLVEQRKKLNLETAAGKEQDKNLQQQIQVKLQEQGLQTQEQLNNYLEKSNELAQVQSKEKRSQQLSEAKIASSTQFSMGVEQQRALNAEKLRLINQELQQGSVAEGKGATRNLLSQEEIISLEAERVTLQAENLRLAQQQNEVIAQRNVALQESQAIQATLDNADPMRQQLSFLDQQIQQQKQLISLNSGISKPEEQASANLQLNQLLESRRTLLKQIQERELVIRLNQQEANKEAQGLTSLTKDRFETNKNEIILSEAKLVILRDQLKLAKEYGATKDEELQKELEILQVKKDIILANKSQMEQLASRNQDEIQIRGQEMGLSELDIINEQVRQKQEFIAALDAEKVSQQAITQQNRELRDLLVEQQNLKQAESVKYRNLGMDALGSQGSVPLVQGPTQIGDQQLKEQELQTAMDAINRSFSELSSYNPAFSDMIANVSNLGLAFHQMGEGAQTGQQVAAQGMSTVASMLNMVAQETISSIDQQISAEKERDGKSEESKKKIQKLEAEKAAQQKKAQTEQIVMQTAMGITQALATLPPPVSYAMAATTQLMGQQALKSQQSGSAIASVGEASVPSLSLGERDNRIDVSRSASAGELQYIQGGNGVGNASDFKPRAVGNRAPANHQVMVGENGPEIVAFDTPGTITAQNQASGGGNFGSNFNVTIQALDSESLQSYLQKNGQVFASSMEYQLNSEGHSLYRK